MLPDMNHAWPAHERHMYLGHDNELVTGKIEFFDRSSEVYFGHSIRVYLDQHDIRVSLIVRISDIHSRCQRFGYRDRKRT